MGAYGDNNQDSGDKASTAAVKANLAFDSSNWTVSTGRSTAGATNTKTEGARSGISGGGAPPGIPKWVYIGGAVLMLVGIVLWKKIG